MNNKKKYHEIRELCSMHSTSQSLAPFILEWGTSVTLFYCILSSYQAVKQTRTHCLPIDEGSEASVATTVLVGFVAVDCSRTVITLAAYVEL